MLLFFLRSLPLFKTDTTPTIITCASFTSTFVSLLICLVNASLLPSQKETLRWLGITPILVNAIKSVCGGGSGGW
jgi:hypothetical protein